MDLEDLLLQAAGLPSGSGSNPPPGGHQQGSSSSDDGPDSSDYDTPPYVPPRKRFHQRKADEDEDSKQDDNPQGGSSNDSHVGSNLYKKDTDKEKLAEMTELDREMILSERAQKRSDQNLSEMVRAKLKGNTVQPAKETSPPVSSRLRSSVRSTEKAAPRNDALDKLRERRLKQKDPESRNAARGGSSVGEKFSPIRRIFFEEETSSESNDDALKELQARREKHKDPKSRDAVGGGYSATKADDPGEKDEMGSHEKDGGSNGKGKKDDIGEDIPVDKEAVTYEDIKSITIPRSKLAKWFVEPFFEELIVGCFVRVGIGRKGDESYYRLCVVKNVDATITNTPYELGVKRTHKYLNVAWASFECKWEMAVMSESPPTKFEFKQWVGGMKHAGIRLPTQQDVQEKREAIQKANVLQEKKSASLRPLNMAVEKDRLRWDLGAAVSRRDVSEIERINARLQELEDIGWEEMLKDSRGMKLEIMNRRNRFENFVNAFASKPLNIAVKAGEAGYDPFSRRWTKSRNYYVPRGGNEAAASANEGVNAESSEPGGSESAEAGGTAEAGMVATTTALEAAADAGKLVNTNAPVDQRTTSNSLHDFELPISLTKMQMLEGPEAIQRALMARKQKIEGTIGVKVPEDDGKEHPHAISIEEYRRRRGLL